ncbi:diaminopimelate epimerase [bacterium]|nr:diaminopimelate epimerase [bacterium]
MKITKMHGCGNDFVFMDYEEFQKTGFSIEELAVKLCDRHFGIGADGLIIPFPADGSSDIAWEYYNSDGTHAQMCGNGMRCFAKYVYDKGLVNKKSFSVKTRAGIIKPQILDNGNIKVNMGIPILKEELIPFKGKNELQIQDKLFKITPVSMGNPHCVIFTNENTLDMAKKYGPDIEHHPYFPEKTNVEFVKILSRNEIELSVYERGCGITLACGTGACATVVASVLNNLTEGNVKVNLPGGGVNVEWEGSLQDQEKNIFLIGPAEYSFKAEYIL